MTKIWQGSAARQHFSDLVDAAVNGEPQFVTRRDGMEVVVSHGYFDKTRPTLKDYLLTAGFVEDGEDAFDRALRDIEHEGGLLFDGKQFGSAIGDQL